MTTPFQNPSHNPSQIPAAILLPLREHVDFVVHAADAHDAGFTSEITRCAVALRALFHSPAPFLSLVAQADGLLGGFLSTALPRGAEGVGRYGGLITTANFDGRSIYFSPLDSAWYGRWLKFADWWNEPVFIDERKKELSRRDVVLAIAAKDGGSNVDPNLAVMYARLSEFESASMARNATLKLNATSGEAVTNPERAAMRQIVHETLRTLFPTYRKFPKPDTDPRLNTALAKAIERPASLPFPPAIRRNDACPCGSGKKLKYCHGAI